MSTESTENVDAKDSADLASFGYPQKLNRAFGSYSSFALAFSMITITTTVFTLFSAPFQQMGGDGIWLWVPVTLGVLPMVLVYAHLSARLPVTGYAYQWSSRLVNRDWGSLVGWAALCSFFVGTASIALAMGSVFASQIWASPTQHDIQLVAGLAILATVIINLVGVRLVGLINNIGASTEIIGTIGLAVVTLIGLFFFKHSEGISVLWNHTPTSKSPVTLTVIGLAALLPIYTLLGWEGSADLAEETKDPRKVAPQAMIRSVVISGIAGFFVYAVFAMAIPHGIADTVNQSENPIFYIISTQMGSLLGNFIKVVAFISIFSALLANVTVATRMSFALSRDNMLPFSKTLSTVSARDQVPIYSVLLVGVFAFGINLLSAGFVTKVLSLVSVAFYATYILTMIAALIGDRRGNIPEAPERYFNLGKWLRPMAWIGIIWSIIVVAYGTLPVGNRIAAEYFGFALLLGVVWWAVVLRGRLQRGEAGVPGSH
jgi:amino acid transporter